MIIILIIFSVPMQKKYIIVVILMTMIACLAIGAEWTQQQKRQKGNTDKQRQQYDDDETVHKYLRPGSMQFWRQSALATFLALSGGFCSGMTIGLNSLSVLKLKIMKTSQNQNDRRMANRILQIIHDHHLMLATLLLGNAVVLQALPLVIHLIMPDWMAIIFSTVIVLVVAQVVPMSLSTGDYKYQIAYYGAPLVKVMIKVFFVVCYPIARGLDKVLGAHQEQRIQRRNFITLINNKKENYLQPKQIAFINQVMNHNRKTVKQLMMPLDEVFMIQEGHIIDDGLVREISGKGVGLILVYRKERKGIVGYVKSQEVVIKYMRKTRHKLFYNNIIELMSNQIHPTTPIIYCDSVAIQVLSILQQNHTQIALISQQVKHEGEIKQHKDDQVVYHVADMVVEGGRSHIIGVVMLGRILEQIAGYGEAVENNQEEGGRK